MTLLTSIRRTFHLYRLEFVLDSVADKRKHCPLPGPGAWGIPAHTSTHPYAIPSRHHALQQKEGDSRLPPSPSDPAQSANLRRAALLRSLQMRGQAPSTAHSPTQVPSGLGQSVSSGFKLGPSALAMGNPPEFRLNRGVETGAREAGVEGKPGWVPAPGGGQSVLSPVPEMDPQEGAMMDETGGQEGVPDGKRKLEKEEMRGMSDGATYQSGAARSEDSKEGWKPQTTRVKGWGESSVKKDLNAGWEQDEKRAISDFRPAGSQWGPPSLRKWGGAENGLGGQKPGWSPQGGTGSARGLADGFNTTPRPGKSIWGTAAPKSPPLSGIAQQQKSPQWKAGASNLLDEKEDPLSPGEPMSPGWGTDAEDFPPLTPGGKQGQGSAQQGERKVVWRPRLKANSLELTSSPDYGSFTDRGSYMQVSPISAVLSARPHVLNRTRSSELCSVVQTHLKLSADHDVESFCEGVPLWPDSRTRLQTVRVHRALAFCI